MVSVEADTLLSSEIDELPLYRVECTDTTSPRPSEQESAISPPIESIAPEIPAARIRKCKMDATDDTETNGADDASGIVSMGDLDDAGDYYDDVPVSGRTHLKEGFDRKFALRIAMLGCAALAVIVLGIFVTLYI